VCVCVCACVRACVCVTTQHTTVLIIFPLNLQTNIIAHMATAGGTRGYMYLLAVSSLHTKFEMFTFTHSKDSDSFATADTC